MPIINAIVGVVLLLFGRRLFWFFVAAAGFALGMFVAQDRLQLSSQALVFAIALLAGLAGALLSMLLQKVAVGIAGFAAGGLACAALARSFGYEQVSWVAFVLGGIAGAIVLSVAFEWALIVLSSLLGAALVSDRAIAGEAEPLVFLVALVVGIVVQALQRERKREPRAARAEERRVNG